MYDIIGDVHGHADQLEALLKKLGYNYKNGAYSHSERKLISVGDLCDRGPAQRRTIDIIRAMHEADQAHVIMGNHEFKDRKSTRLNSSHVRISYAVFCLKKKKKK